MNNCKQLFVSHDFRSHSMLFAFCLIYNWDALNLTHRERYSYQIMVLIVLMNISLATFDRLRAHLGFLTHQWDCHGFIAERDLLNENSRQTITYFACMNAATFDNAYVNAAGSHRYYSWKKKQLLVGMSFIFVSKIWFVNGNVVQVR